MIAGLEEISEGDLKIGGEVVNQLSPKDRDIAMVFQNYALYPHMSVRDNMGFALRLAGTEKEDFYKRTEASRLQQRLGTTTIYVTHDQTEALTLGDRVAVMRSGVLQQVGEPMELYNQPVNLFVAGFIGSPAMNFMPASVDGDTVKLPFGDVRLPSELHDRVRDAHGRQLIAGIRPE